MFAISHFHLQQLRKMSQELLARRLPDWSRGGFSHFFSSSSSNPEGSLRETSASHAPSSASDLSSKQAAQFFTLFLSFTFSTKWVGGPPLSPPPPTLAIAARPVKLSQALTGVAAITASTVKFSTLCLKGFQ